MYTQLYRRKRQSKEVGKFDRASVAHLHAATDVVAAAVISALPKSGSSSSSSRREGPPKLDASRGHVGAYAKYPQLLSPAKALRADARRGRGDERKKKKKNQTKRHAPSRVARTPAKVHTHTLEGFKCT